MFIDEIQQLVLNMKLLLLSLMIIGMCEIPILALVNFTIPKTDIVHTKSGLILHYLSDFQPADRIVTFTVTIPMTTDMCYLIPKGAKNKIPQCKPDSPTMQEYEKEATRSDARRTTTSKKPLPVYITPPTQLATKITTTEQSPKIRTKRALPIVIAIGAGIVAGVLAVVNMVQAANLRSEVKAMENTLKNLDQATLSNQAQILHLSEGQLKLALELNNTQIALNKTIAIVNEHAGILRKHEDALRIVLSQTVFLSTRLASVVHSIETHFIHTSIEKILLNELNLLFVHRQDISKVVDSVLQAMNITGDEIGNSLPAVEVITRLLVRQQIDFVQSTMLESANDTSLIGKLMFTSFFAAPNKEQTPFAVYELIPIPFNQDNKRLRIAQMPAYLGINSKARQFIRWSKEEAAACDFVQMTTCRESPVRRKETQDDCIYQLLTDAKLEDCRVERFADKLFVRRVGKYWAVSTINATKCHTVTSPDIEQHLLHENEEVIIPPMALITTMNTKTLACDRFSLPGMPVASGEPIQLIYNESVNPLNKDILDLQAALANESHWEKLPYFSSELQAVIDFMKNTPKTPVWFDHQSWKEHTTFFGTIVTMGMIIALGGVLLFYIRTKKSVGTNINITMPSMRTLQNSQEQS